MSGLQLAGDLARLYAAVEQQDQQMVDQVGGFADQVLLFCYKYDPTRGRYSAAVINLVRAGALLTVVSLVTFIGVSRRRERRVPPTDPRGNEEV